MLVLRSLTHTERGVRTCTHKQPRPKKLRVGEPGRGYGVRDRAPHVRWYVSLFVTITHNSSHFLSVHVVRHVWHSSVAHCVSLSACSVLPVSVSCSAVSLVWSLWRQVLLLAWASSAILKHVVCGRFRGTSSTL